MKAAGTVARRGDERRQLLIEARRTADASTDTQTEDLNRSTEMQLMHEDLARAHAQQRLEEAVRAQRRHRLVAAHRAARRAEQSAMRARRLLASVVVG